MRPSRDGVFVLANGLLKCGVLNAFEQLRPELQPQLLGQRKHLHQPEVEIHVARTPQHVRGAVPKVPIADCVKAAVLKYCAIARRASGRPASTGRRRHPRTSPRCR